jgi:tetratricopeptide (TPR) repeat protein
LLALRTEIEAGRAAAERDRALLERLADIRSDEAVFDDPDGSVTDGAYAEAFREAGIDLARLAPAETGAKIKSRPQSVVLGLTGALDDWAAICRGRRHNAAAAARLSEAARAADPDPWRNELRTALDQTDPEAQRTRLQDLARKAKFEELDPISLQLLGSGLNAAGDRWLAESVLRRAQQQHPRDVWLNYELGQVLEGLSRPDEAIRFYTAARAIRPETAHELAHALESRGESDEAIAVFCDLVVRRPKTMRHLVCLSGALKGRDRSPEVAAALAQAVAAQRKAAGLQPNSAEAHANLGVALGIQGKLDEAIAEFRTVQRLDPGHIVMWEGLGVVSLALRLNRVRTGTPDQVIAELSDRLGKSLRYQGQLDDAIAAYREAIRLNPNYAEAHCDLGATLARMGDYAGGLQMYRKGHELGSRTLGWSYPSAHWVARAERALALAPRLPGLLRGEDQPRDNAERLTFAAMAKDRRHYVLATRLWMEALASDPGLVNDLKADPRYEAACSAALAVAGQAEDAAQLDDRGRVRLRKQALAWLRADLALLESRRPADPTAAREALRRWQEDSDLADLRNAAALTKLPAEERAAFSQLWADVATLVQKAHAQERTQSEASAAADRDLAAGRTQDALVPLAALSAARPNDNNLLLKVAALQAWFGQEKELAATGRRALAWAKNTTDFVTADCAAKACCLVPWNDNAQQDEVRVLARKALQLGKDTLGLPWYQNDLGMAEYRSGHFAEADAALIAAAKSAQNNWLAADTSRLYRAMSLFRQGKENEARQLAIETVARMTPLPKDEKNPLADYAYHDHLILWLAYKEAKALIQFDATAALQKGKELERALSSANRDFAAGRIQDALVPLAALSAARPEDTQLFLLVAALQAWFGQDQELAATCRRGLELAKNTTVPATAERVAKVCCLRPSTDKVQLEAVLALARKAVQLGKDYPYIPWYQMVLGMAEYRSGHFAEADATLLAAAQGGKDNPQVEG